MNTPSFHTSSENSFVSLGKGPRGILNSSTSDGLSLGAIEAILALGNESTGYYQKAVKIAFENPDFAQEWKNYTIGLVQEYRSNEEIRNQGKEELPPLNFL